MGEDLLEIIRRWFRRNTTRVEGTGRLCLFLSLGWGKMVGVETIITLSWVRERDERIPSPMERWLPALPSPLTDTDECLGTPCQQRCKNSIGSYKCSCRAGFHLHGNRHSCIGESFGLWVVHLGCQSGRRTGQAGA